MSREINIFLSSNIEQLTQMTTDVLQQS